MKTLIVLNLVTVVLSTEFTFLPSNGINELSSWENSRLPCENDIIRFDQGKELVTVLSGPIMAKEIQLPDDGIIYFDDEAVIGEKGDNQCAKREEPQDAMFVTKPSYNFFESANWKVESSGNAKPGLLHIMKIPGNEDTIIFKKDRASRIFLNAPVTVKSIKVNDKAISQEAIQQTLMSVEGQFQWELNSTMVTETNRDGVAFLLPIVHNGEYPINISDSSNLRTQSTGVYNRNLDTKVMDIICSFQKCAGSGQHCSKPFRPLGHCCDICGSMLTVQGPGIPFDKLTDKLNSFKSSNSDVKKEHIDISLIRISPTSENPAYQITVMNDQNSEVDDGIYYDIQQQIIRMIRQRTSSNLLAAATSIKETYSFSTFKFTSVLKILLIILIIIGLLSGVIYVLYRRGTIERVRTVILNRDALESFAVRWRPQKRDDDHLELVESDPLSEAHRSEPEQSPDLLGKESSSEPEKSEAELKPTLEKPTSEPETGDSNEMSLVNLGESIL